MIRFRFIASLFFPWPDVTTMAELALGILGIVPLVAAAIKSYGDLTVKYRSFRHCSSTVCRVDKKLRVQHRILKNECHLLLRSQKLLVVQPQQPHTASDGPLSRN